jgi:hypothetical protein
MTQPTDRVNPSRPMARLNSNLDKSLVTYMAVAGAAGVSMLALSQPVEAKVVYTPTYVRLGGADVSLDINHDGTFDFLIRAYGFCTSRFVSGSLCGGSNALNASSYSKGKFMGAPGFASALRAGAHIGSSAPFSARQIIGSQFERFFSGGDGPPTFFGPFANGGKGVKDRYIGLKFTIGKESHYGWMRISVGIPNPLKPGYDAIITGYAYETEANKAIVAGQKTGTAEKAAVSSDSPAPVNPASSLGMLARGADALALWRRDEEAGV